MKKTSFNISKKDFCNALEQLKEANDLKDNVNHMIFTATKVETDFLSGYGMSVDHAGLVVHLLELLMHDTDDTVSWWCWEADFGRKEDFHIFINDEPIDTSTPEKLYDYLVEEASHKTQEDKHE